MTSKSLPSALEPYLRLPSETSLILLTSTLGCSINWLVARFVGNALSPKTAEGDESPAVLLVSWMRDLNFWKNEIRRATGADLAKAATTEHFAFVDCFSNASSTSTALSEADKNIQQALAKFSREQTVLLVLDNPDILLATASTTAQELNTFVLDLRSHPQVHATYLSASADLPLVSATVTETRIPVEAETAAFVASQAHASRLLFSGRELETGAAKDVSGVLRITRGGDFYDLDDDEDEDSSEAKEAELLYLVQRDGSVKVFGRGADAS